MTNIIPQDQHVSYVNEIAADVTQSIMINCALYALMYVQHLNGPDLLSHIGADILHDSGLKDGATKWICEGQDAATCTRYHSNMPPTSRRHHHAPMFRFAALCAPRSRTLYGSIASTRISRRFMVAFESCPSFY